MSSSSIDVTVNITAHNEGLLLYKTLRSVASSVKYAESRGLKLEVNISLDNHNEETEKSLDKIKTLLPLFKINTMVVHFGDLGLSRNYLIKCSNGKYIAFFDGDDFFTENYLYDAFVFAEKNKLPAVYSPEFLVSFEGSTYITRKLDDISTDFNPINLVEINYFISQSFVHSKIYSDIKYKPNSNGYGMEDWHWNCEVRSSGYMFYNVPSTIFFYRRKKQGSLLQDQVNNSSIIRRSKFFEPNTFIKQFREVNEEPTQPKKDTRKIKAKHLLKFIIRNTTLRHYLKVQYEVHKTVFNNLSSRFYILIMSNGKDQKPEPIAKAIPRRLLDIGINEETLLNWSKLNLIEPLILTSKDLLDNIPIVEYAKKSKLSDKYFELCLKFKDIKFKDIVLVPHLIQGGADLAAINLCKTLGELEADGNVLVITTVDVESKWLKELNDFNNIHIIESLSFFEAIEEQHRIEFILKIIQNWGIKRLSIINSEIGYKIATKYNYVTQDSECEVFLHTYAYDMTDDGYIFNYIPNGLVDAYKGVNKYITDTECFKNQLMEINGFDEDKISTLYLPVSDGIPAKTDYKVKKRVLWASRIHESKLVSIAVEVGKMLSEVGIELHFYGSMDISYETDNRFKKMIENTGMKYNGAYSGFGSINTNNYDIFLLTSKNEGMPNVILEACKAGIFIVAPSVGGVPECIDNGINGFLVKDKLDPRSYFESVMEAFDKRLTENEKNIKMSSQKVTDKHSKQKYIESIKELILN